MQDRGMNPSHVNEQPFRYWIHYFTNNRYHVDWASSALARMKLLSLQDPLEQQAIVQAWWYPKNLLIFAPNVDRLRSHELLVLQSRLLVVACWTILSYNSPPVQTTTTTTTTTAEDGFILIRVRQQSTIHSSMRIGERIRLILLLIMIHSILVIGGGAVEVMHKRHKK